MEIIDEVQQSNLVNPLKDCTMTELLELEKSPTTLNQIVFIEYSLFQINHII
jgi:hypothetical protein